MHEMKARSHDICELKTKLLDWVRSETAQGFSQCGPEDIKLLGEVVDMIKDLAECEKLCQEACYYESVVEAMDGAQMIGNDRMGYTPDWHDRKTRIRWGDDETRRDRPRMGRYGDWDDSDMDEYERDTRHGEAFNRFRQAKRHYAQTHSEKDRSEMKYRANDHLNEVMMTMNEIWEDADPELRKSMKTTLTKFTNDLTV